MIDDRGSSVTIRRSLGYYSWLRPLYVFISGQWVGKVYGNRTKEFSVAPGEHLVVVALSRWCFASLRVRIQDCDRVELMCITDALPLHPWHVHSFWFIFIFAFVLHPLGALFPPIRALMDKLVVEMQIALGMGLIGMMIFFWRSYKSGVRRPTIYLTPVDQPHSPG